MPLTLILDGVSEPGNAGAILRAAAAAGVAQVLLPKGCVDIWSSKVSFYSSFLVLQANKVFKGIFLLLIQRYTSFR